MIRPHFFMIQQQWTYKIFDEVMAKSIADEFSLPPIIAKIMALRGIVNREQSRHFFFPDRDKLHSPFLMKDMQKSVDRIELAIVQKEKILVYGDYDVDGTTSVAMMYLFLKKQGIETEYYIPCRYDEGYGISLKGIDYAKANNFKLIVALDCGIRAVDQVDYAN